LFNSAVNKTLQRKDTMKAIRIVVWMLLVATANFGTGGYLAAAETYPTKPIRIIVGYEPGGFVDLSARLIAGPLGDTLGQKAIVDNRPGSGGAIGAEIAARAKPDGYTLLVASAATHGFGPAFDPNLRYDVMRDFQMIARLAASPSILAVNPSLPVHSVKELIALARSKPGEIQYGSAGKGSMLHVAAMLFEHLAGVELMHVPYKGGGPAAIAVMSGEVPMMFGMTASVLPFIESGKLRGLAITSSQRSALLPNFPTVAESGVPGYELDNWMGLFAPAGTPRAVVEKLSNAAIRGVDLPQVRKGFQNHGAEPSPLGPDEFTAFVNKELKKWAMIVKATGITADSNERRSR
jgi:tripartite-type tricarboxylate transporter receptor subunit TctC